MFDEFRAKLKELGCGTKGLGCAMNVASEFAFTSGPVKAVEFFCEDDAAPDYESASSAWARLFGCDLNFKQAIDMIDGGDATFYLFAEGYVYRSSYARNCGIYAVVNEHAQWALTRWYEEVYHRPMQNVYRKTLDQTWRQVIRRFGVDDEVVLGPMRKS